MSILGTWGYVGIMVGLLAMVVELFVCLDLSYPSSAGSRGAELKDARAAGDEAAGLSPRHAA